LVIHFPPLRFFIPHNEIYAFNFSFSFLQLWVGVMLTTQPFFIAGIEDLDVATESAFGACFMFMFAFVLSATGMWYDSTCGKKASSTEEEGETDYQLAGGQEFPNYGTSS